MLRSGSNPNGVWAQIVAATPRPEVEELAKIIGKRMIDTNESLWHELCALKEIVADFLTFEFSGAQLQSSEGANSSNHSKLTLPRQDDGDSDSDSAAVNTTTDDFMKNVKDCLSVCRIHEVLPIVQGALVHERAELEAEIALLQTTMDTESEVISRGNTPRRDNISDSFGYNTNPSASLDVTGAPQGAQTLKTSSHEATRKLSTSSSAPMHKTVAILEPGRIRRSDSRSSHDKFVNKSSNASATYSGTARGGEQLSGDIAVSLNKKLAELAVNSVPTYTPSSLTTTLPAQHSMSDSSPSSSRNNSGCGRSRSRVRSRIESARDERFFLDDDIFMK